MYIFLTVWQLKQKLHCSWAMVCVNQYDFDTYSSLVLRVTADSVKAHDCSVAS